MNKRVIIFLLVTFGLTWGLQIPAGFVLGTFENGINSSVTMYALVTLSMFFPLVGALVSQAACKKDGPFDLGFHPNIKENKRFYLMAWLLPPAIALLGVVVYFLVFRQEFDPTMTAYLSALAAQSGEDLGELGMSPAALVALTLVSALTYGSAINTFVSFGEEAGWRGVLYPALAQSMSQRSAAVVSGVIWGIWHTPVILMGHNYGMDYAGFPVLGIVAMVLACTAFGVFMAYLRQRSQSVWPCSLAHGSFNAAANIGVVFSISGLSVFGPSPLALVAGIPLFVLGVICWLKLEG